MYKVTLLLLNLFLFFIYLKLKLLTQFPALNFENISTSWAEIANAISSFKFWKIGLFMKIHISQIDLFDELSDWASITNNFINFSDIFIWFETCVKSV